VSLAGAFAAAVRQLVGAAVVECNVISSASFCLDYHCLLNSVFYLPAEKPSATLMKSAL